jgi:phospholipid/cholesterol/gamma-HCH transport system substrate-binding protein
MAMTERQMQLRIGALVLAAVLLFVGFVLSVGRRSAIFEKRYTLSAAFSSTEGLAVGSAVRLAGVTVGNVSRITFAREPGARNVVMTLAIEERVQDRIRQDSVASIGTIGLLGDKVLDVTVGSEESPVLRPGERLSSQEPVDYAQLLRKGDEILDNVASLTGALDEFLAGKEPEVGKRNLAEALRSLRSILVQVEQGQGLLHELVYGQAGTGTLTSLDRTAQRLDRLVAQIETGDGLLHGLIFEPQGGALVARVSKTAEQLETMTREAQTAVRDVQRIVRDVREGTGLLHALVYDEQLPKTVTRLGQQGEATLARLGTDASTFLQTLTRRSDAALGRLEQAATRVDELVASVERGEGLLPALLFDPSRKQVLTDLEAAARSLREASTEVQQLAEEVSEGEGTLGALIKDPTLYEDVSSLVRGAERSRLLRWLIRSTRERGQGEDQGSAPAAPGARLER